MIYAILANGETTINFTKRASHLPRNYDKVWGLNQQATWQGHEFDAIFIMDDLRYRMPSYAKQPFVDWLKTYDGKIITSTAYEEWPTAEAFPIVEICKYFGLPLGVCMYSTVDYMIALAIYEGATEIHLFGVDMMNDDHPMEMRCSTVGWIMAAEARGVTVTTFVGSWFQFFTNLGQVMESGLYGYIIKPRVETLANLQYTEEFNKDVEANVVLLNRIRDASKTPPRTGD